MVISPMLELDIAPWLGHGSLKRELSCKGPASILEELRLSNTSSRYVARDNEDAALLELSDSRSG